VGGGLSSTYGALRNNTTGNYNTALGYSALFSNTTADSNTAVGNQALASNTTASNNTAVGYQALYDNTTGTQNVAVGMEALANNTTANQNTAVGMYGLRNTTTGINNIAMGYASLITNITGAANVALGHNALYNNTASSNTAVGASALLNNTTASQNTAVGWQALYDNTTGANNVGLGYAALENNTTASSNVAVGWAALYYNTTASQNTAVGYQSLYTNATGQYNTALGYKALDVATNDNNTALGNEAGGGVTTGSSNTIIGAGAGNYITPLTTGSNNIIIGSLAEPSSATVSNEVTIGNDSVTVTRLKGNVGIGTTAPLSRLNSVASNAAAVTALTLNNSNSGFAADEAVDIDFGVGSSVAAVHGKLRVANTTATTGSNGYMSFYTRAADVLAERMRIAADKRVYIACTSAPSATVAGVRLGNPNEALCAFSSGTATVETYQLGFYNGNGLVGRISTNGTATSYTTSSDYRLKENNVNITDAISRIKLLKPYRFNFITDSEKSVDGFFAHEVQGVVPEAISGTKDAMKTEEYEVTPAVKATYDEEDNELTPAVEAVMETREVPDYQGIDQSKLVPLLTAAIQEQQAIIETLTARIEALENK
jgi:trimeric autotransporter adhesin